MNKLLRKILFYSLFLLILSIGCICAYGDMAETEVKDAIYSIKTSYSGHETIIFWMSKGQSRASEAKVYSKPPGMTRIEYISPKHLSHHIVIDNGKIEYLCNMNKNIATESISSRKNVENLDRKFNLLKKNYNIIRTGSETTAGRITNMVELKPKNNDKYLYKLWIDKEHHIILQEKIYKNNSLIHLSHFTDIVFPATISNDLFVVPRTVKIISSVPDVIVFTNIDELYKTNKFKLFLPSYLPEGYCFDRANQFKEKNHEYLQVQYSNGLDILSLFEIPQKIDLSDSKFFEESMDYAVLQKKYKGTKLMIMGNVSHKTLGKVMDSIK